MNPMSFRTLLALLLLSALLRGEEAASFLKLEAPGARGVYALDFSPDGRTLASGNLDGTLRLWDVASAKVLRCVAGGGSSVYSVGFSPDGTLVVAGNMRSPTRAWDAATGLPVLSLLSGGRVGSAVKLAVYSPDGNSIAGNQLGTVCLWDAANGQERWRAKGHGSWIAGLAFSPDGKILATRDLKEVILWEAATGAEIRRLPIGAGPLAFSPDGRLLATGSAPEGPLVLWELASGEEVLRLKGGASDRAVAFSQDGRIVAGSGMDPGISLWDAATGRRVMTLKGHGPNQVSVGKGSVTIAALAFSPDGRTLASGGGDGNVLLWDLAGIRLAAEAPRPEAWKGLWVDLASDDAAKAYAASWALASAGREALEARPQTPPEEPASSLDLAPGILLRGGTLRRERERWILERLSGKTPSRKAAPGESEGAGTP